MAIRLWAPAVCAQTHRSVRAPFLGHTRISAGIFGLAVLFSAAIHAEVPLHPVLPEVLSRLSSEVSANPSNRGTVAVVVNGRLYAASAFGEGGVPVAPDWLFRIASTSKMINAVAAMRLVDAGHLSLDSTVADWVPEFSETFSRANQIELRHLLSNSSGLRNDNWCEMYDAGYPDHFAPTVLADFWQREECLSVFSWQDIGGQQYWWHTCDASVTPPSNYGYSNMAHSLSGLIIERAASAAAGTTVYYEQALQDWVFTPAGMDLATTDPDLAHLSDWAYGVGPHGADVCQTNDPGTTNWYHFGELHSVARNPNGGVMASVLDLGHFAEQLLHSFRDDLTGMLSNPSADALMTPQISMCSPVASNHCHPPHWQEYALGTMIGTHQGETIVHHGGGRPGWSAFLMMVPERDFAVAVLMNSQFTGDCQDVALAAVDAYRDWIFVDGLDL